MKTLQRTTLILALLLSLNLSTGCSVLSNINKTNAAVSDYLSENAKTARRQQAELDAILVSFDSFLAKEYALNNDAPQYVKLLAHEVRTTGKNLLLVAGSHLTAFETTKDVNYLDHNIDIIAALNQLNTQVQSTNF